MASYRSTERSWAANVRNTVAVTAGHRIKIRNRGLRSGNAERGNIFRLCNLELFQNYITVFDEQSETLRITGQVFDQWLGIIQRGLMRENVHDREEAQDVHFEPKILLREHIRAALPASPGPSIATGPTASGLRAEV